MRKWLMIAGIFLLFPWATSLIWMQAAGAAENRTAEAETGAENGEKGEPEQETGNGEEEAFAAESSVSGTKRRILVEREGISAYMDLEDYLSGVIVCQIDPECRMEALKCQAVIARTYINRLMEGRTEIHEEELDLDYLGELDRGIFRSPEKREQALFNLERCRQAVQETKGLSMQYEGRYVLPLFHKMSAGRTRNGTEDFPYLQAAESGWDVKREDFLMTEEKSLNEFAACISGISDAKEVSADQLADQIQVVEKDDSGYVEQIKIGVRTYSGEDVQYALGLSSACYSLERTEDGSAIRITTRGSGHGYGLSQTGADAMAAEGWRCEDILNYYYKNISLVSE